MKKIILALIGLLIIVLLLFIIPKITEQGLDNVKIETEKTCKGFGLNIPERINSLKEQANFCTESCSELEKDYLGSKCNLQKKLIECYCG